MERYRFYLLTVAIIIIVGVVITTIYLYNKPHRNISREKPEFEMTAEALISDFQIDEQTANAKYIDKVIQVTGKLVSISNAGNGSTILALEDEMEGVTCTIDSIGTKNQSNIIQKLEPGNPIVVKGRCDGMLFDVRLSKGTIIE